MLLLAGLLIAATSRLVKTKIADGISISLPADFVPMMPEDIAQRYPSVRAPLGAYTNQERMVDFSVNISATQWPDADIELAQKFFKSGVYNLYNRVDMIGEGIQEIHHKRFIYFEFESKVNGDRKQLGTQEAVERYTYILYLVERGRTLVFSFNCPKDQRQDWQETARAMVKTLRVR